MLPLRSTGSKFSNDLVSVGGIKLFPLKFIKTCKSNSFLVKHKIISIVEQKKYSILRTVDNAFLLQNKCILDCTQGFIFLCEFAKIRLLTTCNVHTPSECRE